MKKEIKKTSVEVQKVRCCKVVNVLSLLALKVMVGIMKKMKTVIHEEDGKLKNIGI